MLQIVEGWILLGTFEILPSYSQLRGLRVVWQTLLWLFWSLFDFFDNFFWTCVPAVGACLAFSVFYTDLIGGTKLCTRVCPRPTVGLLAEETFSTILMTMTVLTNLKSLAFSIFTNASPALETVWTTASVIQILAQGSNFAAVWLCLLTVELRVCDSRLGIAGWDALRKFIHPSEFTRHGREVACRFYANFKVTFLLSDIPFTVVGTHDSHRLRLVYPPA